MTNYIASSTHAHSTFYERLQDRIMPAFVSIVAFALLATTLVGIGYAINPRLAVLFLLGMILIGVNALAVVALSAQLKDALLGQDRS